MTKITALMDNKLSANRAMIAEHGLSMLIEKNGKRILFDCGQGKNTLFNTHKLGISLDNMDAVVLSHSHYDHSAGFRDWAENNNKTKVLYTGINFFEKKYAQNGIKYTDLSVGFDEDFLNTYNIEREVIVDKKEIFDGIWIVGNFPRRYEFEAIPKRFVRDRAGSFINDDFSDEICIVIENSDSVVVLVGCSHPGILNIVSYIKDVFNKPVTAIYGGTHLVEADEARINTTITKLWELGVEVLGFSHCSGDKVEEILKSKNINSCHLGVGDIIFIDKN